MLFYSMLIVKIKMASGCNCLNNLGKITLKRNKGINAKSLKMCIYTGLIYQLNL